MGNNRGILFAVGTFVTTLAHARKAVGGGMLCLMLPGCLLAGTTLTYTGNPYPGPSSYGCSGSYVCNGTTPFLSFQFHTSLSVSQLANLTMGSTGQITGTVTSWNVTDKYLVAITQQSTSSQVAVNITTNAGGTPTAWTVASVANSPVGNPQEGCSSNVSSSSNTFPNCNASLTGDYSWFYNPSGSQYGSGGITFSSPYNGTPGTWVVTPDPNPTITIAPATPLSSGLAGVNPPSGLSFSQSANIGSDHIASNDVQTVGWNLPAAATNVSISAYVSSGAAISAYLTNQIGAGTSVQNQIATTTITGTSDSTGQPTTIFTGLNLAAGNYYLTLVSQVTANASNVPFWYAVNSAPGPWIVNSAGGVTGLYEGVATTSGEYPPASTFTSETSQQQTGSPSWNANLFSVTSVQAGTLPVGTVGTAYSQTLTASGGTGPYTWSTPFVQGGSLPPAWLSIGSTTGTLSGTPTANGTFTFTVQATDQNGFTGQQTVTLLVNFAGTVITTNLPAGMAIVNLSGTSITPTVGGNGASNSFTANGAPQTLWSAPFNTAGQLLEYTVPPGTYTMRVIDPADAAYAFPSLTTSQLNSMWTAWTYNTPWLTDFLVFDSSAVSNNSQTQLFSGAGGSPITSLGATAYADSVNGYTSGGISYPPYDNSIAWMYRNSTPQKTITFPLVGSGPETLIFAVPDNGLGDNQGGVSVLIAPLATQSLAITTTSLANGQVGVAYSATQLTATGGSGTYAWSATGLPTGLTVSTSGVLSGTPTVTGSFPSVYFTVTDPVSGLFVTQTTPFHMTIGAPSAALTITTSSIPQGEMSVAYSTTILATGGYGAYTWSIVSGEAPLNINSSTGVLSSSTPLSGGNGSQFTVKVTDAAGDTYTSPTYTLLVDGAVTISTTSLPAAAVGESWASTVTASGGTTIYTGWSLANQPSWLAIDPTGVLSGVPATAGTYPFSVTVTDSANGTYTANLSLHVTLPVGYVVVNASSGGLVSVSGDGSAVVSTGAGVVGSDIGGDAGGNAIVANGSQLIRVTPYGESVSIVATAPSGSNWVAVRADGTGNLIAGDNLKHGIWKVSADGVTSGFVANYPISNQAQSEDLKILVDSHGNYIVAEDNGGAVGLFSITPAGAVNTVTLTGATLPTSVAGLTFDQNGNYMLLDYLQKLVFRITPTGAATVFASGVSQSGVVPAGLARNPLTNEYAVGLSSHAIAKISADGGTVTQLAGNSGLLTGPSAILTLTGDFPSTVDATNPIAYFRLETASGVSEVSGSYTYNLTGGASNSTAGAPIGSASNNDAMLDGSSGYVATNLAGNVNTAGSIMAWVNLSVLPSVSGESFNYVAGESQQGNDFDVQFTSANAIGFYNTCCGNSISFTPQASTLVGQWHMIVATFDAVAGTRALYWDGALVYGDNCVGCSSYTNKTGTFEIGSSLVFPGRNFPGAIDEVAVWNYALTPALIYRMYASRPPATTGIVTSLTPTTTSLNTQTSLTIYGQGFSSNCDGPCPNVWFTTGGLTTFLTPSSFGSTQIAVTVPASLLTNAGPAEVSVVNPAGVPSNALPFTVQGAPLSISPATSALSNGTTNQMYSQQLTASGGSGNYSWSILSQSTGLNLAVSPSTGSSTYLTGTPTVANTDGGLQITVQLTDTTTLLTQSQSYFIIVNQGIPTGTQPTGTTAYILNEDDSLVTVTGGVATSFAEATGCEDCYDMARDAAGNLIIAAGNQITRYSGTGAALQSIPALQGSQYFSVAIDSAGNYIVADNVNHRILRIAPNSPFASQVVATYPVALSNYTEDVYVRVDSTGNYIVVEDNTQNFGNSTLSLFTITPAGAVTSIPIAPAGGSGGPISTGGLNFDANGNYVDVDWNNDVIYTIAKYGAQNAGTATALFYDPNRYLSDPEGIFRDPLSGYYFLVDDENGALYTFAADGSHFGQIVSGGLLNGPSSVVVAAAGPPPISFTPAPGTLSGGVVSQLYTQALTASGGSGNYAWSITSQSSGLNLSLSATTGSSVSLTGTPTLAAFNPGLTITVKLTDTTTTLTQQQTYNIPVYATSPTTWTVSGTFTDGGTLSGTFTLNSSANTITTWNLVATAGTTLAAFTYTPSDSSASYSAAGDPQSCPGPCVTFISNQQFSTNGSPPQEENRILDLSFLAPLVAGNTVGLYINNSNDTASHECLDCAPYRLFSQGSAASLASGTTDYVAQSQNFTIAAIGAGSSVTCPTNICSSGSPNDIVLDASGNFIVATFGQLVKITPAGVASVVSNAPSGSQWISVAVDSSGYYIVADNELHRIVRISPAGTVVPVANYPIVNSNELEDVIVRVDSQGNYIVIEDNGGFHLYKITPSGTVTQITPSGTVPTSAGGLTFDAGGNYVIADYRSATIDLVTLGPSGLTGVGSVLYSNPNGTLQEPLGLYRDPASGNYLIADALANSLYSLTSNGSTLGLVASGLARPVAVVTVSAASNPLTITTTSLPSGTQAVVFSSVTLAATGGSGSYTWSATGLPTGMNLSTGGILSGTPGASGSFTVMVTVMDTASHSTTVSLPLTIASPPAPPPPAYQPLSITTSSLPNGTIGVSYGSVGLGAYGGSGNYSWSIGGLPAGLSGNSAGVISGTPTASGTFTVSATVNDSTANQSAQQTLTLSVSYGPLTLAGPANLGGFAPSAAISAAYTASGGETPYKWSATGLPTGLAINPSSGSISGSIAKPGNYSFTVQVTDAEPVSASMNVSLFVLGITTTSLPAATNKIQYSQTLSAIGGNPPPYSWSVTGSLPPGLSLSGSGVLSGTPVLTGAPSSTQTFSFGVTVTAGAVTVSTTLSLSVTLTPQALSIPGAGDNAIGLAGGILANAYSQALGAAGGIPPYSWSVLAGSLPPGLSLNAAGTVSGTATQVGSFSFTAQVTDSSGGTASGGFSIAIAPPPLAITTGSPLPGGIAGTAYPSQTFTASGGNGPYTFSVQGAMPNGLKLSGGMISGTPVTPGTSAFTLTVTDSSQPALTASSEFQISVAGAHTDLVLSETSLAFTLNAGAISLPSSGASETVSVGSNSTQNLGYSVSVMPAVTWLDVSGGATTPGLITASLDPKALSLGAGVVKTSIVVTCVTPTGASQPSPCAGSSQTIAVTLNVTSLPPVLSVGPALLSYSAQAPNLQASTQSLVLQNTGGGTITVNSVTSPAGYVSFSGVPATLPANSSVSVSVIVDPVGLAGAYYQTTALVNTSVGSASVPISLLVTQFPSMTLSPAGGQFQMLAGSSPGNPNGSFLVDVSTTSSVAWTATVLPGSPWLQLNTPSGSSTSAAPGVVSYSIVPAAAASLAVQPYYGTIQVTANGAVDSIESYLVILNVAAATTAIQPDPEPAGLVFIATGTGALVPPQTVPVYASSPAVETYSASSDSPWLSVITGSGIASTGLPGNSNVYVSASGLLPGVYRGSVSYQFTGSGAAPGVRSVNVTLIVEGAAAASAASEGAAAASAASEGAAATPAVRTSAEAVPLQSSACSPTQLVPTQTGLVNSFSQPASWPTPLTVFLVDNCGNPITKGQVVATFSNGDPPLALNYSGGTSGNYTGTWTPRGTSAQITISARATSSGFAAQTVQIAGQVTPNATPLLTPGGTLNAFAPVVGAALAPGTIVQIYGQNLAGQPGTATTTPLPSKLSSTSVLIGGMFAPLYYVSPGQINAQIPFELSAGNQYQIIVNANGALSTPSPVQLSAEAPGIAGFPTGEIIAQHLDGSLVLDASPAAPGEVIVFYVSGMGLTTQDVTTGAASPSTTLAQPVNPPTISVGGVPVTNILFSGLTPTLVGLYQVDFQVPATVPNGDLPLVLTQSDGSSNTAVLPVHN